MPDNGFTKDFERATGRWTVHGRYRAAFPNDPLPREYWQGDPEELEPLLEKAIARGRPLTPEDLQRAQGFDPVPPPPDVVV